MEFLTWLELSAKIAVGLALAEPAKALLKSVTDFVCGLFKK